MRHLAFYKELAKCPDEVCDVWRTVAAGLLVLRYFDWWLTDGPGITLDQGASTRLAQALEEIPRSARPARRLLQHAVSLITASPNDDPTLAVGPLLGYARYLEEQRSDHLAADVLLSVIDALMPLHAQYDPHTPTIALLRLANIQRRTGAFDDAAVNYERAIALANTIDDRSVLLTVQLWRAGLWRDRGNLGDAELEYTQLLSLATDLPHLRSMLLRGRGATHQRRGQADDAIRDLYEAFTLAQSDADREVILGDLASCAADSGLRTLARQIHESLAIHARGAVARAYALANCFEHAIVDGDQVRYRELRHRLRTQCDFSALPGELELHVAYLSARGLERFGGADVALAAYDDVATHAHQAKRFHIEHEARSRIDALRAGTAAAMTPAVRELPPSLDDIAKAVTTLRVHVTS